MGPRVTPALGQKVEYEVVAQYDGGKMAINVELRAEIDSEVTRQTSLQRLFIG
jgi:hypothetical protein